MTDNPLYLQPDPDQLRLYLGQVVLLLNAGALRFVRDDSESRAIAARWREAIKND